MSQQNPAATPALVTLNRIDTEEGWKDIEQLIGSMSGSVNVYGRLKKDDPEGTAIGAYNVPNPMSVFGSPPVPGKPQPMRIPFSAWEEVVFQFSDLKDAVLFKLTFADQLASEQLAADQLTID